MQLQLTIPNETPRQMWDEDKDEFVDLPGWSGGTTIQLMHSLISISKWEAKWHESFLQFMEEKEKDPVKFLDYIRCMTITKNVKPDVYDHLTTDNIESVLKYINDPMTATRITRKPGKGKSRKIVTSEQIYSWMVDAELDIEVFEKWHLNRLLVMLEVRNISASPSKKMSSKKIMKDNTALNAARRAKSHSKG